MCKWSAYKVVSFGRSTRAHGKVNVPGITAWCQTKLINNKLVIHHDPWIIKVSLKYQVLVWSKAINQTTNHSISYCYEVYHKGHQISTQLYFADRHKIGLPIANVFYSYKTFSVTRLFQCWRNLVLNSPVHCNEHKASYHHATQLPCWFFSIVDDSNWGMEKLTLNRAPSGPLLITPQCLPWAQDNHSVLQKISIWHLK